MRKGKTDRVPRTRAGGQWTEAAYWGFIRSGLRQMSRRWPPIARALQRGRRKYVGPNKRQKWEVQCDDCGNWLAMKSLTIHHVEECGPLSEPYHLQQFIPRLFCEPEGLRKLCQDCHEKRHELT